MPNEFKIKNGFFSEGSSNITGSLNVSAGITGSLQGTASFATTASVNTNGNPLIGGSITSSQVAFGTATGVIGGDAGLTWDNTNKRLGINSNSPTIILNDLDHVPVYLVANTNSFYINFNTPSSVSNKFRVHSDGRINLGDEKWDVLSNGILQSNGAQKIQTSTGNLTLATAGGNGNILLTPNGTGNVGIGTTSPTARLHVQAPGALSTDIAFLVRNSAGTLDIIRAQGDGSVFIGLGAGSVNTGANNTAHGVNALGNNTTGNSNTAIGGDALRLNTTGFRNVSFGFEALRNNVNGSYNVAIGYNSLRDATGIGYNTAIGLGTGQGISSGYGNTFLGYLAGSGITTGNNNTVIGVNIATLASSTTNNVILADGGGNIALRKDANHFVGIGYSTTATLGAKLDVRAQGALSTDIAFRVRNSAGTLDIIRAQGNGSVFIGLGAGNVNTGANNTANGVNALLNNTTGANNTANGLQALRNNTTGNSNTANGVNALLNNTTGGNNTANGFQALFNNTTGGSNTANGFQALFSNTTGVNNTANGVEALSNNTTGGSNTANGLQALFSNTTGNNNTANGFQALRNNTTGNDNTAYGYQALFNNTTGANNNTANGFYALRNNTTGGNNTANGFQALFGNTTGGSNTANGTQAGRFIADGTTANTITNNSVFLGAGTRALADNQTNQIVIGHNAIGLGSNSVVLGNDSITLTALKGNVGIGTTSPDGTSILDLTSTTQGFLPPRMREFQRDDIVSPAAGLMVYNTDTDEINVYTNNNGWRILAYV